MRIIATINEPAEKLIEEGRLRKDLYFRLGIVRLQIPPLRDRKSDIPILVDEFLKKYNDRFDKQVWMVSDKAMSKLMDYDYPGNIRELENVIMGAVSMADDEHVLTEDDISIGGGYKGANTGIAGFTSGNSKLADYLEDIEKTLIGQQLMANDGNVSQTARDLGMLRQNLQHKIKKYGL